MSDDAPQDVLVCPLCDYQTIQIGSETVSCPNCTVTDWHRLVGPKIKVVELGGGRFHLLGRRQADEIQSEHQVLPKDPEDFTDIPRPSDEGWDYE